MNHARIEEIIRQFPENGIKLLLENPANVRDLLRLSSLDMLDQIDLDRLQLVRESFVRRDYRHVESDVVLVAPLKTPDRRGRELLIYILIEHQSEPDPLMGLRLVEYVVHVYNRQVRQWSDEHGSLRNVRLMPVLPLVFYTGTRVWETLPKVADLIEGGPEFARWAPDLEALFVNLPAFDPQQLLQRGGWLGRVLRLVQGRKARKRAFRTLLEESLEQLSEMPEEQRLRWLELLTYIQAMIYHERKPDEHEHLRSAIYRSVQTDPYRQELFQMAETIAEALKKEGREEGLQGLRQALLYQLEERFNKIPAAIVAAVEAADSVEQLTSWLKQVNSAKSLRAMKIKPPAD